MVENSDLYHKRLLLKIKTMAANNPQNDPIIIFPDKDCTQEQVLQLFEYRGKFETNVMHFKQLQSHTKATAFALEV